MSREQEIADLIDLQLRADQNDALRAIYNAALIDARTTAEEFDHIDRIAMQRRAEQVSAVPAGPLPAFIPVADQIAAFRSRTPMARLYRCIGRAGASWGTDDCDALKAYVMACFSELAYLPLTEQELGARDRYKIFEPSLVLAEFKRSKITIALIEVLAAVADIVGIGVLEVGRCLYLIARTHSVTVIAVRGTVTLRDWLMDFEALKNSARYGFYHRGFAEEAEAALPLLVERVGDTAPLHITGHSLGAGVASILAQRWPEQAAIRTPYLFASPRFGTRAAAARLRRYAYVRPLDLVPHAPPRWLGYSDAGATLSVLPPGAVARGGWRSLLHTISHRSAEHHFMEGIRALLGRVVDEVFPERVYIDALIQQMKNAAKQTQVLA
ncbi:hypothetical protein BH10PSE14_BH10PSE14_33610 [soil metagenome]